MAKAQNDADESEERMSRPASRLVEMVLFIRRRSGRE